MTSTVAPFTSSDLTPGFEAVVDPKTRKTYYLDQMTKRPNYILQSPTAYIPAQPEPYTSDLPYPYERMIDVWGRSYYGNHETNTTSWMHPVRLGELKATGILDTETGEYEGEEGQAWRGWILEDVTEGEYEGIVYWVSYRTGGVDWQSPEDKRIGGEKFKAKRAAAAATATATATAKAWPSASCRGAVARAEVRMAWFNLVGF
jgi:hypothetical protein